MTMVLVLEDNPVLLRDLVDLLKLDGFEVQVAQTVSDTLTFAAERRPDLIVASMHLAELDGFELYRLLHTCEPTAGVPLLLLTHRSDPEFSERLGEEGIREVLVMPFTAEAFLLAVRQRLDSVPPAVQKRTNGAVAHVEDAGDYAF